MPESARGQSVVSGGESFIDVALLAGRAEADGSRMAALVIDVAPGWKTYWRHPGSAGIPPSFDWSYSGNLASAEIQWPRPHAFESFGITTLGYDGRVVFPVHLVPDDTASMFDIALSMTLGVCKEICVLEETHVSAQFAPEAPDQGAEIVAAAEAEVPRPATELGLRAAICRIAGAGKTRRFEAALDFTDPPAEAMVILEGPEATWFSKTESGTDPTTGTIAVMSDLSLASGSAWVNRSDIRMTVLAPDFAADIRGCTAPAG